MTNRRRIFKRGIPLILCIAIIWIIRYFPAAGESYARHIYPIIAHTLSAFSSLFPFSVGDCFIVIASCGLLICLIRIWIEKTKRKERLLHILLSLGWIYVWFYFAWGLNYFREDFYTRTNITPVTYTADTFDTFLTDYVIQLNANYTPSLPIEELPVAEEIRRGYEIIADSFGLAHPPHSLKAKFMLFSPLISKVGVTGYMGPFFTEFNLNREIRPEEYPGVYAHEAAHRLGIAGEAEANFYAWLVCTRSKIPEIRYSGNFLLFGYVLNNAYRLLSQKEFEIFIKSIRPEVIEQYKSYQKYWKEKYSPGIGKVQNYIYDLFLKSNRISSGTKNYSEVLGLVVSWQAHTSLNKSVNPPKAADNAGISGNKRSAPAL